MGFARVGGFVAHAHVALVVKRRAIGRGASATRAHGAGLAGGAEQTIIASRSFVSGLRLAGIGGFVASTDVALVTRPAAISWDASATQYVALYRYGLLAKKWHARRGEIARGFARSLGRSQKLFSDFYTPGRGGYGDAVDWELREALDAALHED